MKKQRQERKKMFNRVFMILPLILTLFPSSFLLAKVKAIRAGEIHTMAGEVIKGGIILIADGKISAVGSAVVIPDGAEVMDATVWILYPGFLAPSCSLFREEANNFESFSPDTSALDGFDFSRDFSRYLEGGITSVYLDTTKDRLISGKGAVVKLAGEDVRSRLVKKDAALRINLGIRSLLPPMINIFPAPVSDDNPITPSRKQFPSSSLGAFWAVERLFRFEPFSGDSARYWENISRSLKAAQEQKIPLIVECQKAVDIVRAIELAKIADMPLIISGAAEAYRLTGLLKKNGISVIAPARVQLNKPCPGEGFLSSAEEAQVSLENIPELIKQGIPVAISADENDSLPDLLWLTQYYQKYGLAGEELLKSITINPARMLGVEKRIGSLEEGKDADILFFHRESGQPLPRLKRVMIEGNIVYEQK